MGGGGQGVGNLSCREGAGRTKMVRVSARFMSRGAQRPLLHPSMQTPGLKGGTENLEVQVEGSECMEIRRASQNASKNFVTGRERSVTYAQQGGRRQTR